MGNALVINQSQMPKQNVISEVWLKLVRVWFRSKVGVGFMSKVRVMFRGKVRVMFRGKVRVGFG